MKETTVTLLEQTTEMTMTVLGERKVTIDKDNSIYTTLKYLSNTSTKNRDPNKPLLNHFLFKQYHSLATNPYLSPL
jgi:hypothetical protein